MVIQHDLLITIIGLCINTDGSQQPYQPRKQIFINTGTIKIPKTMY